MLATLFLTVLAPAREEEAAAASSGVSRLARSQRFIPQPRVVGMFFRPPKPPETPEQIKPSGGGQPIKPPPPPEVAKLGDDVIEQHAAMLQRRVAAVESRVKDRMEAVERSLARISILERKKAELDAVTSELHARRIKRQIEAEDEMIITALLAA